MRNAGRTGGNDVVRFRYPENYGGGCTCLSPDEYFADNLTDHTFTDGSVVNNDIRSHKWVTSGSCARRLT
ncbi:hypothetical protein [Streptomyces sp. NPDC017202]|uniref:hypothetical protein n=1 Tax=Streptomyces sp. NPDC017202 TaxID=3364981 RepID=UPI0037A35CEC